jgi:iron complex transport system ATP-binding protein
MIARALVQDTPILLLDEPTANLDRGNQILVLEQIKVLAKEGYTVLQTTHDPEQSYMFSDKILTMKDGTVLSCGPPAEILNKETMKSLYGVDMEVSSLFDDRARFCVPVSVISDEN